METFTLFKTIRTSKHFEMAFLPLFDDFATTFNYRYDVAYICDSFTLCSLFNV